MSLKLCKTIFFFFIYNCCFSQSNDSIICNNENISFDKDVVAYIKGKKGREKIKWKFFYKDFILELSDPTFEIVQFAITWDDKRKGILVRRVNYGSLVKTELQDAVLSDKKIYSLENIAPGSLITFDDIRIKKNGICYKISGFIIYTILK